MGKKRIFLLRHGLEACLGPWGQPSCHFPSAIDRKLSSPLLYLLTFCRHLSLSHSIKAHRDVDIIMAFTACQQMYASACESSTAPGFQQLQVELDIEKALTARLLRELSFSQRRIQELQVRTKQLEAMASLQCLSDPIYGTLADEDKCTDHTICDSVGKYPASIRKAKIAKYKAKIIKYRRRVQISRCFKGRSLIAQKKLREKGRFISLPLSQ